MIFTPEWFVEIDRLCAIQSVAVVTCLLSSVIALVLLFLFISEAVDRVWAYIYLLLVPVIVVSTVVAVNTPNTRTLVEMKIAEAANAEEAADIYEAIEDAADKIMRRMSDR